MGHDENTNDFNAGGGNPSVMPAAGAANAGAMNAAPNPRAALGNNRLGMRPSRKLSAKEELERISVDSNPNTIEPTGTGDIVLNNSAPKSGGRKIVAIIVLVILLAIVAIVAVVVTNMRGGGVGGNGSSEDNKKVHEIIATHKEDVLSIEEIFEDFSMGRYSAEHIFNEEFKGNLEKNLKSLTSMKNELSTVTNVMDEDNLKNDFDLLKTRINEAESKFTDGVSKYNNYYNAIILGKAEEIKSDTESNDSDISNAAKTYYDLIKEHFDDMNKIKEQINKDGCGIDASPEKRNSAECLQLYAMNYEIVGESMSDPSYIANIFKPYYLNISSDDKKISDLIILVSDKTGE